MGIRDRLVSAARSAIAGVARLAAPPPNLRPVIATPPQRTAGADSGANFLRAAQLRNVVQGAPAGNDPRQQNVWVGRDPYDDTKLSEMGRNGFVNRTISMRPFDATREGWKVLFPSLPAADATDAAATLGKQQRRLSVKQKFKRALTICNKSGHSIILMGIDDQQSDLSNEVNRAKIRRIHWLKVISREDYEIGDLDTNPASENFGKPLWYEIIDLHKPEVEAYNYNTGTTPAADSRRVHWTRVLGPFITEDGQSKIDEYGEAIEDYFTAQDASTRFVSTLSIGIYKVREWLNKVNTDETAARGKLNLAALALSALNAYVLDKDEEDFDWKGRPTSGIGDILDRKMANVCAFTGIPGMKLFGQDPKGFSTGAETIDSYNTSVQAVQTDQIEPELSRLIGLLVLCEDGPRKYSIEQDSWVVQFNPLRVLSSKEQGELRAAVWTAVVRLVEKDVLDRDEARQSLFGAGAGELSPTIQLSTKDTTEDRGASLEVGTIQAMVEMAIKYYESQGTPPPASAFTAILQASVSRAAPFANTIFQPPPEPSTEAADEMDPTAASRADPWLTPDQIAEIFGSITAGQLKAKRATLPKTREPGKLTWTVTGRTPLYKYSEVKAMFDVGGEDLDPSTEPNPAPAGTSAPPPSIAPAE